MCSYSKDVLVSLALQRAVEDHHIDKLSTVLSFDTKNAFSEDTEKTHSHNTFVHFQNINVKKSTPMLINGTLSVDIMSHMNGDIFEMRLNLFFGRDENYMDDHDDLDESQFPLEFSFQEHYPLKFKNDDLMDDEEVGKLLDKMALQMCRFFTSYDKHYG